jgi:hypothetical protein
MTDASAKSATTLIVGAVALALMLTGAQAQSMGGDSGGGGLGGGHKRQQQKTDSKAADQKPKVDEKAYDAALKSLPDKKYDPWSGVR